MYITESCLFEKATYCILSEIQNSKKKSKDKKGIGCQALQKELKDEYLQHVKCYKTYNKRLYLHVSLVF